MYTDDPAGTQMKLEALVVEHRDLDAVIHTMSQNPFVDQLLMRRLKKRKLQLKDQIERLQSSLIPDLDA